MPADPGNPLDQVSSAAVRNHSNTRARREDYARGIAGKVYLNAERGDLQKYLMPNYADLAHVNAERGLGMRNAG